MATLLPTSFLPLPLIDFSILIVLKHRRVCHGYGIWQEIRSRNLTSPSGCGLPQMYKALSKLRAQGIIEFVDERSDRKVIDDRRRNYYITTLGVAVFNAETARLASLIQHTQA
jgi:DNA-binding PadR family transcriptional regulator